MDTTRELGSVDPERSIADVGDASGCDGNDAGGSDADAAHRGGCVISRADAAVAGLNRFFTGRPCKNGHVAERWTLDVKCVACDTAKKAKKRRVRGAGLRVRIGGVPGVRKTALAAGKSRYFSGAACPRGHVAERMTSTGRCVVCLNTKTPEQKRARDKVKKRNKSFKRDAIHAAATLTELLGVPHVVIETVDATGKKTFQPVRQ